MAHQSSKSGFIFVWNIDKDDERFLIDQILPFDRNTGKISSDCGPEEEFDMDEIKDLTENLTYAWPNWPAPEDGDNLWAKDWKSHGSCLKSYMTGCENGYFKQGRLRVTMNINCKLNGH